MVNDKPGSVSSFSDNNGSIAIKKGNSYIVGMTQSKTIVSNFVKKDLLPVLIVIAIIAHLAIVLTEIIRVKAREARISKLIYAVEGLNKSESQYIIGEDELGRSDSLAELAREIDKLQKTKH